MKELKKNQAKKRCEYLNKLENIKSIDPLLYP